MVRTRMWPIILFSFFFVGCSNTEPTLAELAVNNQYELLLEVSKDQFTKDFQAGSLYYLALAQARTNRIEQAYHSLLLYDQLVEESMRSEASLLLMMDIATQIQDYRTVVEKARKVEKFNTLDTQNAKLYYHALQQLKEVQLANHVLITYLRQAFDTKEFSRMLFESEAPIETLKQVIHDLDDLDEILALLQIASQKDNSQERALTLFELAGKVDTSFAKPNQLKLLYELSGAFAQQADLRVQANKYETLAQQL